MGHDYCTRDPRNVVCLIPTDDFNPLTLNVRHPTPCLPHAILPISSLVQGMQPVYCWRRNVQVGRAAGHDIHIPTLASWQSRHLQGNSTMCKPTRMRGKIRLEHVKHQVWHGTHSTVVANTPGEPKRFRALRGNQTLDLAGSGSSP